MRDLRGYLLQQGLLAERGFCQRFKSGSAFPDGVADGDEKTQSGTFWDGYLVSSLPWFRAAMMAFRLAVKTWMPVTVAKSPSSVITCTTPWFFMDSRIKRS